MDEPVDKRCAHCLPQGDAKHIYNRRKAVRRCAEVVGLESFVDGFEFDVGEDRGEVFLKAKLAAEPGKVASCRSARTHLGARSVEESSEVVKTSAPTMPRAIPEVSAQAPPKKIAW